MLKDFLLVHPEIHQPFRSSNLKYIVHIQDLSGKNLTIILLDESVIFYSAAQKLKPYSEEARFGLILPKAAQGKWNEVIELYNKILEVNPQNTVALYRLGLVYYGRKDYNNAYPPFKKVVELYRDDIIRKWIDFFVYNIDFSPEKITKKL